MIQLQKQSKMRINNKQKVNLSTKGTKTKQNSFQTVQVHEEEVDKVLVSGDGSQIIFKIVVIGESFVGKTSLIKAFTQQNYQKQYNVTVGAQFATKTIELSNKKIVKLSIWDTCGHDVFKSMTSSFYRGAAAVFLTFSIANRSSFEKVKIWHQQFFQFASPYACVFLIGTKIDEKRQVSEEEAMKFLKQINGLLYVQTSSQTGENVKQGFLQSAEVMYKLYMTSSNFRALANPLKTHGSFLLSSVHEAQNIVTGKKKKCC